MRAAIYVRVSTEEQTDKGTIETQRQFAASYCQLHAIGIADWYADDGVSGVVPLDQRPEGKRLLADAAAGKFDAVMIYRIDRLSRSLLGLLQSMQAFERLNVAVRSMTEPIDTSTPLGRFVLQLLGMLAELERETFRERSWDGASRLAREGRWNGGVPPLGYTIGPDGRLQIQEAEAALVRRIFRLYTEDRLGAFQIADLLTAEGVPPVSRQKGRRRTVRDRWEPATVSDIVSNPAYAGEYLYRKSRTLKEDGRLVGTAPGLPETQIAFACPALVDAATFARAAALRVENVKLARRNAQREYLLAKLIRCGVCGLGYTGGTSVRRGHERRIYRCLSTQRKRSCHTPQVDAEEAEAAVWDHVLRLARDPEAALAALSALLSQQEAEARPDRAEEEALEKRLRAQRAERQRVIGMVRRGTITEAEGERELSELVRETAALEAQMGRVFAREQETVSHAQILLEAAQALARVQEQQESEEFAVRRDAVLAIVDQILVFPADPESTARKRKAEIRIYYRFRLDTSRERERLCG